MGRHGGVEIGKKLRIGLGIDDGEQLLDVVDLRKIDAVAEPWEGITSILVPQALTLAMVERTGCRLPPRFQYAVMEQ